MKHLIITFILSAIYRLIPLSFFTAWCLSMVVVVSLFNGCVSEPEPVPVCNTYVSDICNKSNFDGSEVCGYPTMKSCMNKSTVFGFTCFEVLEETCEL